MLLDSVLEQIDNILDRLKPSKLDAYKLTQDQLHKVDVSKDERYQKTYTGFYVLRLPTTESYKGHFSLLESSKSNGSVGISEIINSLHNVTGRIEASFSSKIVATINPNIAPLDSVVLGHLGLTLPKSYESNRLEKCITTHSSLIEKMGALVTDDRFKKIKQEFSTRHPNYKFTDAKILDLVLWQYRP